MISASTAFMQKVNNGEVPLMRMQLTTSGGRTIWLEDGQFWGSSVSFSEATSQDGAFTVGDAVIGGYNFSLTNFDRSLDSIDFEGAVVIPFVYFDIDGTNEYLPKGVFYIASHSTSGNIIKCTAYDALKLLDQSNTSITYPITVQNLIQRICTANNITLATQTIPHGSFVLNEPPKDNSGNSTVITDRQKLSYACQCIGCFAKMDEQGHLEVKWYDFANPVSVSTTFNGKSLWTAPITVTGLDIEVSTSDGTTTRHYGTDARVIKISSNPYITLANSATVWENISEAIIGKTFRPGTLPVLANPCLQAGDVLQVTDRSTNLVYLIPITSTSYDKTLTQNVICAFEQKTDTDLRPSSSYNMRVSVDGAIAQAQTADAIARAAQEMAETSSYQPFIISNKGTAFVYDTTADLTAVIYDKELNEVDPDGTGVIYRWWITKDGMSAKYLDGGKTITIPVSDSLCDYAAGIYFETKDISEGVNPFLLSNRNSLVLTTRSGVPLSVRAAEVYG